MQLQWKKTLNSTELETLKNWRKVGIFYAMEVSRYPPFLTYFKIPTPTPQPYLFVTKIIWNWFLGEQMLWAPFLWPLGVYIEFKVKLQTHTNKKKKKFEQENGRELSNDKLYTINLSRWRMETPFEHKENTLWICVECWFNPDLTFKSDQLVVKSGIPA